MGTADRPGSSGILTKWLDEHDRSSISEETCRKFANHIGFHYKTLTKGTFTDKHEDPDNREDRSGRFLPQYFDYFASSPSTTQVGQESISVDLRVEDREGESTMEHRVNKVEVEVEGAKHEVDMGGVVDSESTAISSPPTTSLALRPGNNSRVGSPRRERRPHVTSPMAHQFTILASRLSTAMARYAKSLGTPLLQCPFTSKHFANISRGRRKMLSRVQPHNYLALLMCICILDQRRTKMGGGLVRTFGCKWSSQWTFSNT